MTKTYSELIKLNTLEERYNYLKICSQIGIETFGNSRYLNQMFYNSSEWKTFRNRIILRDNGCELGLPGYEIAGKIYIHHLNPITIEDVLERSPCVIDPDNAVCVSLDMHNCIHYGKDFQLMQLAKYQIAERKPNDTCPWRKDNE